MSSPQSTTPPFVNPSWPPRKSSVKTKQGKARQESRFCRPGSRLEAQGLSVASTLCAKMPESSGSSSTCLADNACFACAAVPQDARLKHRCSQCGHGWTHLCHECVDGWLCARCGSAAEPAEFFLDSDGSSRTDVDWPSSASSTGAASASRHWARTSHGTTAVQLPQEQLCHVLLFVAVPSAVKDVVLRKDKTTTKPTYAPHPSHASALSFLPRLLPPIPPMPPPCHPSSSLSSNFLLLHFS